MQITDSKVGEILGQTCGVALTLALEYVGVQGGGGTDVGVAVAQAPPTHTDLPDGVVVPPAQVHLP